MVEALTKVAESCNKKSCSANFYPSCNDLGVFRSDRLEALMREQGISQSELARRVGVSPTAIWKLLKDPAQGSKHTHRIARELGVSSEFLMGETDDQSPVGGVSDARLSFRGPAVEPDPDMVQLHELDLAFGMGATYLDLPVKAQTRSFSREWLRNFTAAAPKDLFFARGVGDSMMPTILDSDIVLIDRSQLTPVMGDQIWAVAFGQVGMIKRLRPMPDGSVKILSDNPSVPPETACDGELHVLGRVVTIMRKC